jgi:predicted Zn-dependent protease
METHHYRYYAKGRISGYMLKGLRNTRSNRYDLAIVLITAFAIISIHSLYKFNRQPWPYIALETQMNNAYVNKDISMTMESCQLIIEHYPEQAAMANLLAGNSMLISNEPEKAAGFLSEVRKEYPDSPGPMIALGLAYQLQGHFLKADENYTEFSYIFDEVFPEIVSEIQHFRYLMQEGFRAPPKWSEIYRYQLMHEL